MTRNLDAEGNTISGYIYTYDPSGFILTETVTTEERTEQTSYGYDNAGQLIQAVRDGQGLLMAALYDGDNNRMFTASRTEDTKAYQLYRETEENTGKDSGKNTGKNAPKISARGEEGSIFWYGFGQNFIWKTWWNLSKTSTGKKLPSGSELPCIHRSSPAVRRLSSPRAAQCGHRFRKRSRVQRRPHSRERRKHCRHRRISLRRLLRGRHHCPALRISCCRKQPDRKSLCPAPGPGSSRYGSGYRQERLQRLAGDAGRRPDQHDL
jgi:hypothetical protein